MDIVFSSERLALRRFTPDDLDLLLRLDGDPEVMRYLTGGEPTPRETLETTTLPKIIAGYDLPPRFGCLAGFEKSTADFVGWFLLRVPEYMPETPKLDGEYELGYRLRQRHWGKGYATEMSRAIVEHAFTELDTTRLVAQTMAVNTGSRRVMEKLGMSYVGRYFPDLPPIPGSEHGEVVYWLTRADWKASRKPTQET